MLLNKYISNCLELGSRRSDLVLTTAKYCPNTLLESSRHDFRWVSLKLVGDRRAGQFGRNNHFRSALFFLISIYNWLQLQLY